jgi:hypothetical protein
VPVVIPELVYIVGLFFAVVGYMMARGALATYTHSLGFLLRGLEGVLKFSAGRGFAKVTIDLGGPVRALDRAIVTALQTWCDGAEIEMGYCLHGLEKVGGFMAQAIDFVARETSATFDWLVHIHLPKWAKILATALFPWPAVYRFIRSEIAKALPHIRSEIHTVTHTLPGKTITIIKHAAAGAVAIPGWVIHIPGELRGAERQIGRLSKRITKTEALFGATALSIAMANVLGLGSARCLRSGNIGKVARRLCGLDSLIADALLADLAIMGGTLSIVEFAKALQKAEPLIASSLAYLVNDIGMARDDVEAIARRSLAVLESLA